MKPMHCKFLTHLRRSVFFMGGLSLLMTAALPVFGQDPAYPDLDPPDSEETSEDGGSEENFETAQTTETLCIPIVAPFKADRRMRTEVKTSLGSLCCTLFAGEYPLTVLNFRALAQGKTPWTDAQGKAHTDAYYRDLPFGERIAGAFVLSGLRAEGNDFVVVDEGCQRRSQGQAPLAGDLLMVQSHPGMASTQFMLLARDQASFRGMYVKFGHCGPLETIDALTREDAQILEILIDDHGSCDGQP